MQWTDVTNKLTCNYAFIVHFSFAQQWKKLANDLEVNLYDVVEEAEIYFKNIHIYLYLVICQAKVTQLTESMH